MKTILTLVVLSVCMLVVGAPIGPSLALLGLAALAGSYKVTKSGAIDGRSKVNIIFVLLGLALLVIGCILTSASL